MVFGGNTYRILGFFHGSNSLVLTHGFMKKTPKTPLRRSGRQSSSGLTTYGGTDVRDDLDKYISKRKKTDKRFAEGFESGYQEFKIGYLLRNARGKSGMTQDELAKRLRTTKSAISRIENHADDVRRFDSKEGGGRSRQRAEDRHLIDLAVDCHGRR